MARAPYYPLIIRCLFCYYAILQNRGHYFFPTSLAFKILFMASTVVPDILAISAASFSICPDLLDFCFVARRLASFSAATLYSGVSLYAAISLVVGISDERKIPKSENLCNACSALSG